MNTHASPLPKRWQRWIPRELRWEPTPLPERENARGPLIAARKAFVSQPEDDEALPYWMGECEEPPPQSRRRLLRWAGRNAETVSHLEEARRRGRLQATLDELGSFFQVLIGGTDLRELRGKSLLKRRRFREALAMFLDHVELGAVFLHSELPILGLVTGMHCQVPALERIRSACLREDIPAAVLQGTLERLEKLEPALDSFRRALRVELCSFMLPEIHRLTHGGCREQAEELFGDLDGNEGLDVWQALLAGHPEPFSAAETARLTIDLVQAMGDHAGGTTTVTEHQSAVVTQMQNVWPEDLEPYTYSDPFFDETPALATVDSAQVAKARRTLRRTKNPVGRLLVGSCFEMADPLEGLRGLRLHRESTRAILALRIATEQAGELPTRLESLVESGILDSVPQDPYAGQALGYSKRRGLLWSVGEKRRKRPPDGARTRTGRPREDVWEVL